MITITTTTTTTIEVTTTITRLTTIATKITYFKAHTTNDNNKIIYTKFIVSIEKTVTYCLNFFEIAIFFCSIELKLDYTN